VLYWSELGKETDRLVREKPASAIGDTVLARLDTHDLGQFPIHKVSTIGRAPDSQVVLNVRSVSRHHARIFYEGGHFWIKDLDSGNGTRVNGKRIKLQMLTDNDSICFGEAKAVFRTSARSGGPAPLAQDPLEGSDPQLQDGTPTGGLKGTYPNIMPTDKIRHDDDATLEDVRVAPRVSSEVTHAQTTGGASFFTSSRAVADESLEKENERLRRLVAQLEHALADANIRIRNLQARLKDE
jgi:hypothetical protein